MTNNFSDFQKQMFCDIYKTALNAYIAGSKYTDNGGSSDRNFVRSAARIAMISVDAFTDGEGLRKPSDIISNVKNLPSGFPLIED